LNCFLRYRTVRFAKAQGRLKLLSLQYPVSFVPEQVEIHWEPGLRVLYVEVRALITARVTPNVPTARQPENQAMACLVHVVGVKG
jgi:hypothetical protein